MQFECQTADQKYEPEQVCLTLVGKARISADRGYLNDNWRTEWNAFFPKGPSDVDAVFVEVTVERIEVWNGLRGIAAPPDGSRGATLLRAASGDWQSLEG